MSATSINRDRQQQQRQEQLPLLKKDSSSQSSFSITKTASDALIAKASAVLVAGYQPIPKHDDIYRSLLVSMIQPTNDRKSNDDSNSNSSTMSISTLPSSSSSAAAAPPPPPPSQQPLPPPRQSPLVSAGYAMRIASMAHVVHSFVSIHAADVNSSINIIILGCGMDVLGLWAQSLASSSSSSSSSSLNQIHIWEVDVISVAQQKRDKLLQQGLVIASSTSSSNNNNNETNGLVLEGCIQNNKNQQQQQYTESQDCNYHLIAADLRCLDSLDASLKQAMTVVSDEHLERPTLVMLELVLAYLGNESTDRLLQWCATNLLYSPSLASSGGSSALVAFEALGETTIVSNDKDNTEINTTTKTSSVFQSYQKEYTRQFQAKLQRGQTRTTEDQLQLQSAKETVNFHPLGRTCKQVQQHIAKLTGYHRGTVHTCLAGTSSYWAQKQSPSVQLDVPEGEMFDEHAALTLHLASYVQVVAFHESTRNLTTLTQFRLKQRLCPWKYPPGCFRQIATNNDTATITFVTPLESCDEAAIRTLFQTTYESLGQSRPAVKRLVKTALKKEFSTRSSSNDGGPSNEDESCIRRGYQQHGGDFFVAVQYTTKQNEQPAGKRQVLGGIGVRKWSQRMPKITQEFENLQPIYEIHRFFVSQEHRRQGIGKALLQMAESFVASQVASKTKKRYRTVAATLSLLEEANQIYLKHGYYLLEESCIGDLQMKTYAKDVWIE